MRIVMMRHGETEWNACGRIQGALDIPINKKGVRQIKESCMRFKQEEEFIFSFIVASPRLRARQSARICSSMLNIPYYVDSRFRERSFGELEGKDQDYLRNKYGIQDVEELTGSQWGFESISECLQRVKSGLLDLILQNNPSSNILLVTHGSIMQGLMKEHDLVLPYGNNLQLDKLPLNGQFIEMNINQIS